MDKHVKLILLLFTLFAASVLFAPTGAPATAAPVGRPAAEETAFVTAQTPTLPLLPPNPEPCPAGTTNYRGAAAPFSCVRVYRDNEGTGYPVGLRAGRTGPSPFGLLHALLDHNVEEETIARIITNTVDPYAQGNDRFLYAADVVVNGVLLGRVEVIVVKGPSNEAPDDSDLGLLTAYCRGLVACPDTVNEAFRRAR